MFRVYGCCRGEQVVGVSCFRVEDSFGEVGQWRDVHPLDSQACGERLERGLHAVQSVFVTLVQEIVDGFAQWRGRGVSASAVAVHVPVFVDAVEFPVFQ